MADTPIETPLETARRVWPGIAWKDHGDVLSLSAFPGGAIVGVSIEATCSDGEWSVVTLNDESCVGEALARGPDLAAVLAEARDKVRGAVAELARAVGLEVSGG